MVTTNANLAKPLKRSKYPGERLEKYNNKLQEYALIRMLGEKFQFKHHMQVAVAYMSALSTGNAAVLGTSMLKNCLALSSAKAGKIECLLVSLQRLTFVVPVKGYATNQVHFSL